MADRRIDQLTESESVNDDDLFVIWKQNISQTRSIAKGTMNLATKSYVDNLVALRTQLDYSRAVAVSSLPYTAPGDGIIMGNCTRTTNGITSLFINGLVCARADMNGLSYSSADLQLLVGRDDTLTADNSNIGVFLHFVPFKN